MNINIDISKYTSYFHDGSIIDIQQQTDEILIFLESVEIKDDEIKNQVELSAHSTLKGVLHLKSIDSIIIDNKSYKKLQMIADSAGILELHIEKNKIRLLIEWINFPPKDKIDIVSDIIIVAKKIYWENVPDLYDPFG